MYAISWPRPKVLGFLLGTLLLLPPSAGHAQGIFPIDNGIALAGVKSFDARVEVGTWLNMEDDRERFEENTQTAFELGLRRDGVIVNSAAPNYLFCSLKLAQSGGTIAYSYEVQFFKIELEGVYSMLWRSGGIVTVGSNNFAAGDVAGYCVDDFTNEWLKQNPPR